MLRDEVVGQPDHGLVEPGRRINLEFNVEHFPMLAKIGDDVFEFRLRRAGERVAEVAFVVAGERVVETPVAFQRRRRADETLCSKRGRPHPVARGLRFSEIGVHHAGALAFDQAAGKTGRERDCTDRLRVVEPHQFRRRRRGTKNSIRRARAITARLGRRTEIARHTALHFVAGDDRSQKFLSAAPFALRSGNAGGNDEHAGVCEHVVRIALVVYRNRHAIRKHRADPGHPPAFGPHCRPLAAPHFPLAETFVLVDGSLRLQHARQFRARQRHGHTVVDECLALVDDIGRKIRKFQTGDEFAELHGERFVQHVGFSC